MKNENKNSKWAVVDDAGNVYGHDLDRARAEAVEESAKIANPDAEGIEIIDMTIGEE